MKKRNLLFLWMLILAVIFSGVPFYAAPSAPADVTDKINPQAKHLYIGSTQAVSNGALVPGASQTVNKGETVTMYYQWEYTAADLSDPGIQIGDTFTLALPSGFTYPTAGSITDQANPGATATGSYGSFTISGSTFTGTFSQANLESGWVQITATANVAGSFTFAGQTFTVTEASGGGPGGGGNDAGQNPLEPADDGSRTDFSLTGKDGKLDNNRLDIVWDFKVCFEDLKAMVEGGTVKQKSDILLTDELDEDLRIDPSDLRYVYLYAPFYAPTPEGKMSGLSINTAQIPEEKISRLTPNPNETKEAFISRIKNVTTPYAVGLYTDSDETQTLYLYFGKNFSSYTYAKLLSDRGEGELDHFIESHSDLSGTNSNTQKKLMKKRYGTSGPSSGNITGFTVSFTTKVDPKGFQFKEKYTNTAHLTWTEGGAEQHKTSNTAEVTYSASSASAGATLGNRINLTITKTWKDASDTPAFDTVTVKLYGSTADIPETPVGTYTISKDGGWKTEIRGLRSTLKGKAVNYRIEETPVPTGFSVSYGGESDAEGNITLTKANHAVTITNTKSVTPPSGGSPSGSTPSGGTPSGSSPSGGSPSEDAPSEDTPSDTTPTTPAASAETTTKASASTEASSQPLASESSSTESDASPADAATDESDRSTDSPFVLTSQPTAATTSRTFEFVEIDEDIPLGIKTTAPLDLELILIEEDVPLGTSTPSYPYAQLPYTGFAANELFLGVGLFIISVGAVVIRRWTV